MNVFYFKMISPSQPTNQSNQEVFSLTSSHTCWGLVFFLTKILGSRHTEPQEVRQDVEFWDFVICSQLQIGLLPSNVRTSFFDKPPTKQWQVRQVSFYYQSKHCTIIGEILQHHHAFAACLISPKGLPHDPWVGYWHSINKLVCWQRVLHSHHTTTSSKLLTWGWTLITSPVMSAVCFTPMNARKIWVHEPYLEEL